MTKTCKICSRKFHPKYNWIKYCSNKCSREGRKFTNRQYYRQKLARPKVKKCEHNDVIKLKKSGLTVTEISTTLGISVSYASSILSQNDLNYTKSKFNIELNETQKQLMLGSLLGDASLNKIPSGKVRAIFVHSVKQENYLLWKYNILENIVKSPPSKPKKYGYGFTRSFRTVTNKHLTDLYPELYNNSKFVSMQYLNKLTPLSIAVWFMDDGSMHKIGNCFSGSFATHSFTLFENQVISRWLASRYNTKEPSILIDTRCNKPFLSLHTELCKLLISDISKHIIPSMRYKLCQN